MRLPKPGKVLLGTMLVLGCAWVMIALGLNYGNASPDFLRPILGDPNAILHGQLWRLITPVLVHVPSGPGAPSHIVTTLLGLYFLAPTLEERWGARRMLAFLVGSVAFAYACQVLVGLFVPKLATMQFFGGVGMIEAVAVAWALQNRGSTVNLFFVIPVTGTMLLGFILLMSILNVIAQSSPPEGLVTPFGGMLAGYLFSDVSPIRKAYLRLRLKQLEAQSAAMRTSAARRRASGPPLRVIHGEKDAPKDKRYLN
jgi:membrane associated rhomboid family serine protease